MVKCKDCLHVELCARDERLTEFSPEQEALCQFFVTDNNVGGKWIPVTERLPEMHTKVLCCGVKGGRFIAELSEWGKGDLYWTKRDGKGCPTVTHWMPLPEPPADMRKGENG